MNDEKFSMKREVAVGIMMIIITFINVILSWYFESDWMMYVTYVIIAIGGVIIIFYPGKTSAKTAGIYAVAAGLSSLITLLMSGDLETGSGEKTFLFALITLYVSVMLVINGSLCLMGRVRRVNNIMYGVLYQFAYNAANLVYTIHSIVFQTEISWELIMTLGILYIPEMIIYALFAVIILTDENRTKSDIWSLNDSFAVIKSSICIDGTSAIYRSGLTKIYECIENDTLWDSINVDHIVFAESKIEMVDYRNKKKNIIIRKYRDGSVYVSVARNPNVSFVAGMTFKAIEVVPDGDVSVCSSVRIYGENGVLMKIGVIDPKKEINDDENQIGFIDKYRKKK